MEGLLVAVVLGSIVLVVVIFAVSQARHEKRVKEMRAWAEQRGWRYDEERADLVHSFEGRPFSARGSGPKARHVLSGAHRGHRVLAYEYSYTTTSSTGNTTTTTTHRFRIVAVAAPASTPVLEVREKHFGHRLLEIIGVHDLTVGDPGFDDTFQVSTADDGFARSVLTPDVTRWLLDQPVGRRVPFRFTGDHVLSWESIELDPAIAIDTAEFLIDLLERVPEHAWADR